MGPTVTERVAALLGAFGASSSALTLTELSRRTDLPLTTVHRLAGELCRTGLLERDDDQRFRIGLRLWEIASTASSTVRLREIAMPALQRLLATTGENVQLAVLDGTDAVYVERLSAEGAVHVVTRAGARLPVHATGVGLVLLAHAPADLQDDVLARTLPRFTRHTVTDPRRLRRILADVRRDGHAVSVCQIETVSLSVAAPVRDRSRRVVAAVSVVAPSTADPKTYLGPVREAGRAVSRRLHQQWSRGSRDW